MMNDTIETGKPVRAIIADDHPLVLLAIDSLMSGYPDIQVVGRAADTVDLFTEIERNPCDLVLMDFHMPGSLESNGFDIIRQLKMRYPQVALVILTMETDATTLQKVVSFGVDGLVSKRDRIDLIHVAIVMAMARECYIGPAIRAQIAEAVVTKRLDFVHAILSRREFEVFTQYASGLGVSEIAGRLGRSVKTISAQKCAAMRKLSLQSDAELFRFAVEHGVVSEGMAHRR